MKNPNMQSRQQLLHAVDTASFAAIDTALFLDTHPDDQDALKAFRQYEDARRSAMNAYSEQYGPLTMDTASPCNHWYWATETWPWEGGRI